MLIYETIDFRSSIMGWKYCVAFHNYEDYEDRRKRKLSFTA